MNFIQLMQRPEGKIRQVTGNLLLKICERFPDLILNQVTTQNFFHEMSNVILEKDHPNVKILVVKAWGALFISAQSAKFLNPLKQIITPLVKKMIQYMDIQQQSLMQSICDSLASIFEACHHGKIISQEFTEILRNHLHLCF